MAKKSMKLKYKSKKRERNKYDPTMNTKDSAKSFVKTFIGVLIFLGLMYLMVFGLEKLGLFQLGYTAPTKEDTEFDYEKIPIGTVFTRSEKTYYVLFDKYESVMTSDSYVNALVDSIDKVRVYKVDMSLGENAKYAGEKPNKKATRASELSINDITLIRITNGRIAEYYVGNEEIERHFNK